VYYHDPYVHSIHHNGFEMVGEPDLDGVYDSTTIWPAGFDPVAGKVAFVEPTPVRVPPTPLPAAEVATVNPVP